MVSGRRLVPAAFMAVALVVADAVALSSAEAADATAFVSSASLRVAPFESIFAFGDSFTDTGNNPVVWAWYNVSDEVMRPPYGMTFFHGRPTGRNSNGRLIIDFIECKDFFSTSLFFMGEFGITDYHISIGMKKSMQEIRAFIPDVIQTISMGTERVIQHGVKTVVVPGMIPSGCVPSILIGYADSDTSEYDATTGCVKEPNEIVALHNSLLQDAVEKLQAKHPDVTIIYADLFNHVMGMVKSPEQFGFKRDVLTVCCGGRGRYHYNMSVACGDKAAITCKDPSTHLFWEGVHLTEAAYHYIAEDWLNTILSGLSARASS
ncbi:unnamed protein product [Urochloa decumbens]|uniref:GDSL esterase/lipase n=1 Tax=Urochloa decumbens TaxID=240449 RepID=A0ABC8WMB9_9POAL